MTERDVAELYRRHGYTIHRRCLAMLGDEAAAEDAVQETFVRALRGAGAFRGEAHPRTWLCRIADHLCLDVLRRRRRAPFAPPPWPGGEGADGLDEAVPAADAAAAAEPEALVEARRMMRTLDPASRRLAVLYYLDELTQEEAAAELGISRRTLGKRLRSLGERARALLGGGQEP
jgi:RNA polymerase sigma-70 factor (ECF subfamily)